MRFLKIVAALALALWSASSARAAEPYHLRLGWVVAPADLVTLMFVKPGLAPHAGKTYIPELTHFAGTPAEMTALIAFLENLRPKGAKQAQVASGGSE